METALGLALLGLVVGLNVQAGEKKPVRQIDIKGLKVPKGQGVMKPETFASAEQLESAFKDDAAKIAKEVDFSKEQVVYFGWSGSGQDKLKFTELVKEGKNQTAVFLYTPGLTRDLRPHAYLFATPKGAQVGIDKGKPGN